MKCVCCETNFMKIYQKNSYLKLPIYFCKNCKLYVTGETDEGRKKQIHYTKNHIGTKEDLKIQLILITLMQIHKGKKDSGFLNTNTANHFCLIKKNYSK